jgi:hypothetical protein
MRNVANTYRKNDSRTIPPQNFPAAVGIHALFDVFFFNLFRKQKNAIVTLALAHHNIILSRRLQPLLDDIFTQNPGSMIFALSAYAHPDRRANGPGWDGNILRFVAGPESGW